MGTRGVVGTLKDKVLHASYQQFDSYPSGTGTMLQEELTKLMEDEDLAGYPEGLFDHLAPLVDKMVYVDASDKPTQEQFETYAGSFDPKVSTGDDWYSLLRKNQNSLLRKLYTGIATESTNFVKDSLFCEWGYVFDFDERKVLILRGFNTREDKQWEHARLSPSQVKEQVDKSKRQPPGDRSIYYGVSVFWTGTMEEFLKANMKDIEALEVDA